MPVTRRIGLPALFAAAAFALGVAPAAAQSPQRERLERNVATGRPWFIDFRAGLASVTGHSYVVFGRVNERGQVLSMRHAEIWPESGDPGLFVGIFVPVRAQVRLADGDSRQAAVISYRRYLTEAEYGKVMRAIEAERRQDLYWNVWLFNCNHFTNNVADALGLKTPPGLLLPHAYVSALRLLNGRQN